MSRWKETSKSDRLVIVVVLATALAVCCGCLILGASAGTYSLSRDSAVPSQEDPTGAVAEMASASPPPAIQPAITLAPTATPADTRTATATQTATATPTAAGSATSPATPEASPTVTAIAEGPLAVIVGPTQALIGQAVAFSAQDSTAAEGSQIVEYAWEFGDGATGNGITVTHVYSTAAAYGVWLAAVDDAGLSGHTTLRLQVDDIAATAEPTGGATAQPTSTTIQSEIEGVEWLLDGALEGTTLTLLFEAGTASGTAGCNTYSGWYETDAEQLTVAITSIGYDVCDEETMGQETDFLLALVGAESYQLPDGRLEITAELDGQAVTLGFVALEP